MTYSILFVCLGNICRSPLAEAAFREEARRLKLDAIVDSAGTGGWHIDFPPDARAQAVARKHSVDISALRGRQVKPADFRRFTTSWRWITTIWRTCAVWRQPMPRPSFPCCWTTSRAARARPWLIPISARTTAST